MSKYGVSTKFQLLKESFTSKTTTEVNHFSEASIYEKNVITTILRTKDEFSCLVLRKLYLSRKMKNLSSLGIKINRFFPCPS